MSGERDNHEGINLLPAGQRFRQHPSSVPRVSSARSWIDHRQVARLILHANLTLVVKWTPRMTVSRRRLLT